MSSTKSPALEPPPLPTPVDHPQADVVIYDGHCRFCTAQIRQLARWDRGGRLAFVSLHDPSVAAHYPDLKHDDLLREMVIVDHVGVRHAGAAAFRYLTRRLPILWPLAPLMHVPLSLPLWNWLYRQVAQRRYWFGKTAACDDTACKIHVR